MALWYDEVHDGNVRIGLKVVRTLFAGRSDLQKVDVVETEALGRALLIDDVWMTAEGDEKSYHEMIAHPAMTTAPRIERVLVIGGGDGGTVREVLRHPEVRHVDMVEVDGLVVEACREHLATIGTAWDDPRLHVHIADGIRWAREADVPPYDVVLVDGSDPVGPARGLFDEAFFRGCARLLTRDGVFVGQAENPTLIKRVHLEMIRTLERVFERVHPYYGTTVLYPGGSWSWVYATHTQDPMAVHPERAARIEETSDVWNREVHRGAFAVPNHVKRALGR
ncbi:MAG: polyamine aminopropyltransferase [Myxococcota bacterium]